MLSWRAPEPLEFLRNWNFTKSGHNQHIQLIQVAFGFWDLYTHVNDIYSLISSQSGEWPFGNRTV